MPDRAHVMRDVADHFSNLWFAGQARNWPVGIRKVMDTIWASDCAETIGHHGR